MPDSSHILKQYGRDFYEDRLEKAADCVGHSTGGWWAVSIALRGNGTVQSHESAAPVTAGMGVSGGMDGVVSLNAIRFLACLDIRWTEK